MNKRELSNRFSRDVDSLLNEMGVIDNEPVSTEYDDLLLLARDIANVDFSHQSRIRFSLRRRLLAKVKEASVDEVEIPGPVGLIKNLFKSSHRQASPKIYARSSRLALAGLVGMFVIGLISLLVVTPTGRQIGQQFTSFMTHLLFSEPPTVIDSAPPLQLTSQWQFRGEGGISSAPVVADNVLFVGDNSGNLYTIDPQNGAELWRFSAEGSISAAPAVVDGVIYAATSKGYLYAVDLDAGREKWRFATDAPISASPTLAGELVYLGSEDGNIYAIDRETGRQRWRFATGSAISSSPTVVENQLFVGSRDWHIYALDAVTGAEQWHFKTEDWVLSSPIVVDGMLYVGSMDEELYAIDAETGREKWRFFAGDDVVSSPAFADGVIYVGSFDGHLYAVDAQSGQELWRFKTGRTVQSSPVVANDTVYFGSGDGNLYAVDTQSGQPRGRFETDSQIYAAPVAIERLDTGEPTVYVVNGKGQLYAVQITAQESPIEPELTVIEADATAEHYSFQFTPSGWHTSNPDDTIRFQGRIVDEMGNPVNGVPVQADNGAVQFLSNPSGSTANDGEWKIELPDIDEGGWWWLTIVKSDCGGSTCEEVIRLSESVKLEIIYPEETTINADWICHYACREVTQNEK